ncbi:MAG: sulfite exporter TauE/SafE family protein [Flavobacteriales bacterium]|nr:sulfite exporter TauE/SafE family protein [Flavobacteriales bacterium]
MEYLLICILIMAFLYASVGHGGASGYHAIMALFAVETILMKSTALTLNIFVAGISFYHYQKAGYFRWKVFLPFAIGSIPLAYLGGTIEIQEEIYKGILGIFLVFAVLKMLGIIGKEKKEVRKLPFSIGIIFGGILGFFSGLIGIGGGIILSPVLLLFRWAKMKEAAAISSLFILVNSISGLTGIISSGNYTPVKNLGLWILIVIIGGYFGSYLGSKKMSNKKVRYLLVFVLSLASIKLLLTFYNYIS